MAPLTVNNGGNSGGNYEQITFNGNTYCGDFSQPAYYSNSWVGNFYGPTMYVNGNKIPSWEFYTGFRVIRNNFIWDVYYINNTYIGVSGYGGVQLGWSGQDSGPAFSVSLYLFPQGIRDSGVQICIPGACRVGATDHVYF